MGKLAEAKVAKGWRPWGVCSLWGKHKWRWTLHTAGFAAWLKMHLSLEANHPMIYNKSQLQRYIYGTVYFWKALCAQGWGSFVSGTACSLVKASSCDAVHVGVRQLLSKYCKGKMGVTSVGWAKRKIALVAAYGTQILSEFRTIPNVSLYKTQHWASTSSSFHHWWTFSPLIWSPQLHPILTGGTILTWS